MTKTEFLKKLEKELSAIKTDERKKSLSFYNEFIDDGIESGLTEDQAIAQMESVPIIADDIISDAFARGGLKQKRKPFPIALIILGSPLWISLLVAFVAIVVAVGATIFSVYITLWLVIISLFAVVLSLLVSGIVGIIGFFVLIFSYQATAFMFLGASFICIALGMIFYFPVLQLAKWLIQGTISAWKNMVNTVSKRKAK